MREGWFLMNAAEVERWLRAARSGEEVELGEALSVEEALDYRNRGNLPDGSGRTLRLVLTPDPGQRVEDRRLLFEPDFHEAPEWRRPGSKPVNVIPITSADSAVPPAPWWEQEDVGELETEWQRTGTVAGLTVSAEYRSFVLKTVAALQRAGIPVTVDSVTDSISRWLAPADVARIKESLQQREPGG
ncbi:MAG TPA: hypothetical protein VFK89_07150 [Actinomycetota bacterium]|nr:hypothetical protein [Actinomycetota bacterium]